MSSFPYQFAGASRPTRMISSGIPVCIAIQYVPAVNGTFDTLNFCQPSVNFDALEIAIQGGHAGADRGFAENIRPVGQAIERNRRRRSMHVVSIRIGHVGDALHVLPCLRVGRVLADGDHAPMAGAAEGTRGVVDLELLGGEMVLDADAVDVLLADVIQRIRFTAAIPVVIVHDDEVRVDRTTAGIDAPDQVVRAAGVGILLRLRPRVPVSRRAPQRQVDGVFLDVTARCRRRRDWTMPNRHGCPRCGYSPCTQAGGVPSG